MAQVFNIYCDESCHLQHDRQTVMVLGAIRCPFEKTSERRGAYYVPAPILLEHAGSGSRWVHWGPVLRPNSRIYSFDPVFFTGLPAYSRISFCPS